MTATVLRYWCLEYSFSTNSFYSAPLLDILYQNQLSILEGEQHDFILIGIYESKELLKLQVEYWINKMNKKVLYKDIHGNLIVK